jgi:hypothetical protein
MQQFDDLRREMVEGELGSAGESGLVSLTADDLPTNQEIAAIVVREQRHGCLEEPALGGWGLKFLERAHSEDSEDCSVQNKNARCISTIVPQGYHGGVASRNGGPSGLIERWRSGGRCDCGGWDYGCPIRVLNNDGGASSSPQAAAKDSKSVELSQTVRTISCKRYTAVLIRFSKWFMLYILFMSLFRLLSGREE